MTTTTSTTTKKNVDLLVKETPSASASPSPSVGGAAASEATARVVDVGDDDDDDDDDDDADDADRADRADDGATVTRKVVDACFGRPAVLARLSLFSVMSASMAVTDSFLFLYLDSMGGTELLMGVALCFTCLSEVVVFAKEDWIKSRVDTERSIALVLACYAIRQLFYFGARCARVVVAPVDDVLFPTVVSSLRESPLGFDARPARRLLLCSN
jgi:hypothetical protein